MMRIHSIVLLTAILTAMLASLLVVSVCASGGRGEESPPGFERFALVLIDADELACSPCQASLLEFCRAIPRVVQEERILGVLTFRDGIPADSRRARIARTKWNGYSRANDIRFPVTVDEAHAFNGLTEAGTTILLFDPSTGNLRRWTAPFGSAVLEEIDRFLIVPDTPMIGPRS